MLNHKTSALWPYYRAIAKALTIPGTTVGLSILTDVQDQLSTTEFRRQTTLALEALRRDTGSIVQALATESIAVSADDLSSAALQVAEALYLQSLAEEFLYADFKGIQQLEKLIPLKLDEVFVNLRVKAEPARVDEQFKDDAEQSHKERAGQTVEHPTEDDLADLDVERLRRAKFTGEPQTIDRVLARPGGVVLLGGPGSGKTTLIKRLARSLALGRETAKERYPELPWALPIVLPVALYDDQGNGQKLFDFLQSRLSERGGEPLVRVFLDSWAAGQCVILLDGLDEIADTGRRIACARAVEQLIGERCANRVVVTSRPVGYTITRLKVPVAHVHVQPFERSDIETFVRQWQLAYERTVRPGQPNDAQAETQARELISEIQANPRVESLGTNPLMLTIIALIKRQHVTLPERRAKLYEIALTTLIDSWNKARSLYRPLGRELSPEEMKEVLGEVAHWIHTHKSTGTCHRDQLLTHLEEVLTESIGQDRLEATRTAESYIATAVEYAGLLEERGTNVFAFMHQTFQEYLAARYLAKPHKRVVERVLTLVPNPRWHEVIRLTAGYIGVVQEDRDMVSELVEALGQNPGDPLEPVLATGLRLAASCLADDVRVRLPVADQIVVGICERLASATYGRVALALRAALASIRTHAPGGSAVRALIRLTGNPSWRVRMEAARMLGRAAGNPDAKKCAQDLFKRDGDPDVRAHAALGLWRAGTHDEDVVRQIGHGLSSGAAEMRLPQDAELAIAFLKLLEATEASVRARAAEVLGGWGPQAAAVPALLKLLEDTEASVRARAAEVLGGWGPQAAAVPALLKLLEDTEASVRVRAAAVLGGWGPQAAAVPALLKLLEDTEASVRYRAAEVLGGWGPQAAAVPALLKLLEDTEASVRVRAAAVLGGWGPQAAAVPALLKLLEDTEASVRARAAAVLGGWGPQAAAVPALLKLLEDTEASVRARAAAVLGGWGPQAAAVPALLKLLEDTEASVRYRAAEVLGGWGHQAAAVPALLKLLEDTEASVRVRAAAVLGGWGPQAATVSALLKLLEDKKADVRYHAAAVLGGWGGAGGTAAPVLDELIGQDAPPAVAYFESLGGRDAQPPSSEVAALLARALERQETDSNRTKELREVVFEWVWKSAQPDDKPRGT